MTSWLRFRENHAFSCNFNFVRDSSGQKFTYAVYNIQNYMLFFWMYIFDTNPMFVQLPKKSKLLERSTQTQIALKMMLCI